MTCVIVPNDLAALKAVEQPPHEHGTVHSSVGYSRPQVVPARRRPRPRGRDPQRGRAGRDARRPGRARTRPTRSSRSADLLGAGVAKALLGKAVAPRRPAVRDRLDRPARHEAELGADDGLRHAADGRLELPVLGVPARGGPGARACRSTSTARMIGIRYPMDVHLVGDSKETLRRAAAAARAQGGPLAGARRSSRASRTGGELMEDARDGGRRPDQPAARLLGALVAAARRARSSAADSGSAANWFARDLKLRKGMMASLSGTLATMGPGVPYAIAAKFAHPGPAGDRARRRRRVPDERHERADHGRASTGERWSDPRLVVLVLNNHDLNQVTWEQRAMEGDPKYPGVAGAARLPVRALRRARRA